MQVGRQLRFNTAMPYMAGRVREARGIKVRGGPDVRTGNPYSSINNTGLSPYLHRYLHTYLPYIYINVANKKTQQRWALILAWSVIGQMEEKNGVERNYIRCNMNLG